MNNEDAAVEIQALKDAVIEKRVLERYLSLSEKVAWWLIAYGVGIAVLFVTQAATLANISYQTKQFVLLPTFAAVLLQLILVLTIKYQNLIVYKAYSKEEPLTKESRWYKVANWWSQERPTHCRTRATVPCPDRSSGRSRCLQPACRPESDRRSGSRHRP